MRTQRLLLILLIPTSLFILIATFWLDLAAQPNPQLPGSTAVTTANDSALAKIEPDLLAHSESRSPDTAVPVLIHLKGQVAWEGLVTDLLLRPFVAPNGVQTALAHVPVRNLIKLASQDAVLEVATAVNPMQPPTLPFVAGSPAVNWQLPGIKLADFGIAKAAHEATVGLTMVGQVIGTPKYLSPEQVKGERATPLSDLYAVGVVLYEMLAGRPPFEHDSAVGLALAHREDTPPPLAEARPDIDPGLVELIHQALDKDPANRPVDADAMREALLSGARATTGTQLLPGPAAGTQAMTAPAPPATPTRPTGTRPTPAAPPPRRRGGRLLTWVVALTLLTVLAYVAGQQLAGGPNTDQPTAPASAPADDGGGQAPAGGQQDEGEQQPQQQDPAQDAPDTQSTPDTGGAADEPQDEAPDDADAPVVPDDDPSG